MIICILLAGGKGLRTGNSTPKQFLMAHDKPIFTYSIKSLNQHPSIDHIIMVCSDEWRDFSKEWIDKLSITKFLKFAEPGISRQHSILNGLIAAQSFMQKGDFIVIHDAARPIINSDVLTQLIDVAGVSKYALPVIPINDAVYLGTEPDSVTEIVKSPYRYHGQTPVCLDFDSYYQINLSASDAELSSAKGTCTLLLNRGHAVKTVKGDYSTCKLTSWEDIEFFLKDTFDS